jgi:hypothetical protein
MRLAVLLLLAITLLSAQTPTAPPQPTTGPGGSDYPFGSYSKTTKLLDPLLGGSNGFYIYQPENPEPATAPVALFIHGYDGNTTEPYEVWMQHVAQMGFIVIWVEYDTNTPAAEFASTVLSDYQLALKHIARKNRSYVQPATDARGDVISVVFGHSAGAYLTFPVAQLAAEPGSGLAPFKAIVAIEPGQGEIPSFTDVSAIPASTQLVMATGDEDGTPGICLAAKIWGQVTQIPASNRDFLEAVTDTYGVPQQLGNHWFPLTSHEVHDTAAVDDRDYNITWKLSVGGFKCAIAGTDCSYGLGHGDFDQIDMGRWSDGTVVNQLRWLSDPVSYFKPLCGNGG